MANGQLKDVAGLMVPSRLVVIPIDNVRESRSASCSIEQLNGEG